MSMTKAEIQEQLKKDEEHFLWTNKELRISANEPKLMATYLKIIDKQVRIVMAWKIQLRGRKI